jgi:hypothetical protein
VSSPFDTLVINSFDLQIRLYAIMQEVILTSSIHQRGLIHPRSSRLRSCRYRIMTDTGGLYHPPDSAASSVYHNDLIRSLIAEAINKSDDIETLNQFSLSSKGGHDSSLRYLRRKVTHDQVKEWRNNPVSLESRGSLSRYLILTCA